MFRPNFRVEFKTVRVTISLAPYAEKSFPGPLGPGVKKKVEKGSKKGQKQVKNNLLSTFSTFSPLFLNSFLTPRPRGAGIFFRLFSDCQPEGPE